ncbi:SCP2 domain-containing protein [Celerinatantimonas sp. YJH-8]|uniref:ubiquinone anaerobic biosynthesis accessory factor UbiT n=1 Tax=Celerinatantimonas sp. YJH-8 TaxID=3228714 RepID=UPI0038BF99DC
MPLSLVQRLKHRVVENMPRMLRVPVTLVPFSLQRPVLELALNQLLKESINEGELDFLEGRWVALQISDIGGRWFITCKNGQIVVADKTVRYDVLFSGELNDFVLMMGRKEDPDTLFFHRRLVIEGDTQLGLEVKNLLDNIDYDQLPHLISQVLDLASGWVASTAAEATPVPEHAA